MQQDKSDHDSSYTSGEKPTGALDLIDHPAIDNVEANTDPKQRRSNFFSMIAGGAGLMADGYQNSLVSRI